MLLLLWVYLAMVCIGVDSEVVGGVDREVVVVSVRVGVVNVKVDVDIVVVGVCGFAAAEVVGEGVGGIAAAAHFVVVVGVSEVRAIVVEDVGEGDGGMAVAAHFVVVTGVVGVESICEVVGEGVGGIAGAAHLTVGVYAHAGMDIVGEGVGGGAVVVRFAGVVGVVVVGEVSVAGDVVGVGVIVVGGGVDGAAVEGAVVANAVKYLRISVCFLEKSKNLAVFVFSFFFAAFLCFLAINFPFLLALSARRCSCCLSAFLPCMKRAIVFLHWFLCVFSASGAGAIHFALKLNALASRGCLALALMSFLNFFLAAVASHHSLALAASFSFSTFFFHSSLSCAIFAKSGQLILSSTSISMSPGWR